MQVKVNVNDKRDMKNLLLLIKGVFDNEPSKQYVVGRNKNGDIVVITRENFKKMMDEYIIKFGRII